MTDERRRAPVAATAILVLGVVTLSDGVVRGGSVLGATTGGGAAVMVALTAWLAAASLTALVRRLLPASWREAPIPQLLVLGLFAHVAALTFVARILAHNHRDARMISLTVAVASAVLPWAILVLVAALRRPVAHALVGAAERLARRYAPKVVIVLWCLVVGWGSIGLASLLAGAPPRPRAGLANLAAQAWNAVTDPDGNGHGLLKTRGR